MLHYETIPVTAFQQNCSIVWEDEGMTAAVIDPGGDLEVLLGACKQLGITLTDIALHPGGVLYGVGSGSLSKVDTVGGAATPYASVAITFNALDFAPDGTLYGISAGKVVKADLEGGKHTALPLDVQQPTAIAIDSGNATMATVSPASASARRWPNVELEPAGPRRV